MYLEIKTHPIFFIEVLHVLTLIFMCFSVLDCFIGFRCPNRQKEKKN